jgi:LysR family glycine cleavage system transcriptional activator
MKLARTSLLRNLSIFSVAARTLSFKDAARTLYLTPSAVSHQVKDLELTLGLQLFVRKTRSLALTRDGDLLLAEIEPQLQALEQALERHTRKASRNSVRIALPPFFASELLMPQLVQYRQRHPDIDITLDSQDAMPREPSADADLSVFIAAAAPPGWRSHTLFPLQLVAACSAALLPRANAAGQNLLAELPVYIHRRTTSSAGQWAQAAGCAPPSRQNLIELDDMFGLARAAQQGLGIALLPSIISDAWFASGALRRAWPVAATTGDSYLLGYRAATIAQSRVLTTRDWMLNTFAGGAKNIQLSEAKSSFVGEELAV